MKKIATLTLAFVLLLAFAASAVALTPHGNGIKVRNWVTNDTDYSFSDQYKTSVWYHNFSQLELTENHRNNVLMIAISQLGYHEGDAGDYTGVNYTAAGNCTEYARIYSPNYNDNCFDWCATFINWCLNQARINYAYGEMGCQRWINDFFIPQGLYQKAPAYGGAYTPKPADIIFFDWDKTGSWADHIGFVLYVTDTTVYTIEGNTSDNVGIKSYSISDKQIVGYGTPVYEEKGIATFDYSPTNEFVAGQYIITDKNAVLYSEPDTESVGESIPFGALVSCGEAGDGWLQIKYNGVSGYINSTSLFLLRPDSVEEIVTEETSETVTQTSPETTLSETTTEEADTTEDDVTVETTLALTNAESDTEAEATTLADSQITADTAPSAIGCTSAISSAALITIAIGAITVFRKRSRQD